MSNLSNTPMKEKTEGAWLIHHTKKLSQIANATDFEDIEFAGKCGVFLCNLAASDQQSDLNEDVVKTIAKVSNIKRTEIETIRNKLVDEQLIDVDKKTGGISVLGYTTSSVLSHTSKIFKTIEPSSFQRAALDLAENTSDLPKESKILSEYISDTHKLTSTITNTLLTQSEQIGFVDFEEIGDSSKLYFNGNLFRKDIANKTQAVLSSLKSYEVIKMQEVDELLDSKGCVPLDGIEKILGINLLSKLQSIGLYDFNEVSNSSEEKVFVTKPSAFSKFGNPFEEDALDLAKAFVSSLYYGMTYSSSGRGKITMLKALMEKLIRGLEVGPATAIGEDYRILELKRVIKIRRLSKSSRYYMKLLKKDVGQLALKVLETGGVAEESLLKEHVYTGSVTDYRGPEEARTITRKRQNSASKVAVSEMLRTLRK